MKTFLVTVNSQTNHGDPATAMIVGIDRTHDHFVFKVYPEKVTKKSHKNTLTPAESVKFVQKQLEKKGYILLDFEEIFLPIN